MSCSSIVKNADEELAVNLPDPLFKPLPVSVIVYYDDDFLYHHIKGKISWLFRWNVQVGDLNANMFNYFLPFVFKKVTISPNYPLFLEELIGFDLVILPKLIQITQPTQKTRLTILYTSREPNCRLNENDFKIKIPEQAEKIEL